MTITWSHKKTFILVVSLLLISVVAISLFYQQIYPEKQNLDELKREVKQQQAMIDAIHARKDEITEESEKASILQHQLPLDNGISELLTQLQKVEEVTGTTIIQVQEEKQDSATETSDGIEETKYTMQLAADDYTMMHDFLTKLSTMERIVEISSLTFQQQNDEATRPVEIGITTYRQPNMNIHLLKEPTAN
ncbi:type 4a pilus biogenesis protein PilO [Gracilibacillus marinus]|uniref:Type 4a pilus biogenesis protein PilO n=1 Tax=Gracilibacillus marinus TaxID=630535 RepID=A0ABV8VPA3_9BACI